MTAMGWLAAVLSPAIDNRSDTETNNEREDRRWQGNIGRKILVTFRIGNAVAKCITDQQEKEEWEAEKRGIGATPSAAPCRAALIAFLAHPAMLANALTSANGRTQSKPLSYKHGPMA